MKKFMDLLKNKRYVYAGIGVVLIIVVVMLFRNGKNGIETIEVAHSDFIGQVSVSGKVVAPEEVELGFKTGGVIDQILVEVGEEVKRGQTIARVDIKNPTKEVQDAEINLASAKLNLSKLEIENSSSNLSSDLWEAYNDGFTAAGDAFLDLPSIVDGGKDMLAENRFSGNAARTNSSRAKNYRDIAERLYGDSDNFLDTFRDLYRSVDRNSSEEEIENLIDQMYTTIKTTADAVKSMRNFVDYMADNSSDSSSFSSYQDSLSNHETIVTGHLTILLASKQNMADKKESFQTSRFDIQDLELTVRQTENALQDAKNKLSEYYIRAPFDGIVTKIDAKIGEIATANEPLINMIGLGIFEIESFVPEVNIAQVEVGKSAEVTLDAYGEKVLFQAEVISVDPAETVRDGVSTYKVRLQFTQEDPRIKSGMTANVSIIIFNKPSVIVLPGGVIFTRDGKTFVQVKGNKEVLDREVVLGATSALGQVEIVSGLEDGEYVVLNPNRN